jgi:hypothetical protein
VEESNSRVSQTHFTGLAASSSSTSSLDTYNNRRMAMNTGGFMTGSRRSIFRTEAVRRYIQNQREAVLPRFVCPSTFLYLWILLGLLLVAGCCVTWLARGLLLTPPAG